MPPPVEPEVTEFAEDAVSNVKVQVGRKRPAPIRTGPAAAARNLKFRCQIEQDSWLECARVNAVLGSCASSRESILSGLRCYITFVNFFGTIYI